MCHVQDRVYERWGFEIPRSCILDLELRIHDNPRMIAAINDSRNSAMVPFHLNKSILPFIYDTFYNRLVTVYPRTSNLFYYWWNYKCFLGRKFTSWKILKSPGEMGFDINIRKTIIAKPTLDRRFSKTKKNG